MSEPTITGAAPAAEADSTAERADKIVAALALDDAAKAKRVRDLIEHQYGSLQQIHAALEAKIAETAGAPGDAVVAEAYRNVARKNADLTLFPLHRRFVAGLEAELTPDQVSQVKDAMTDGLMPSALDCYRKLLPNLTAQQLAFVQSNLLEAREYAMDVDSQDEMRAKFESYEERIDKYLAAAGYDPAPVQNELARRMKSTGAGP